MLSTLIQIHESLQKLGYEVELRQESVLAKIDSFPVVITINSLSDVVISCQIATMSDIAEDRLGEFAFAALDANTRIRPYAFGIITGLDNPETDEDESDYPIVLTDCLPLGDFSEDELAKSMQALVSALMNSRQVLEVGIQPVAV